ncbi:MAG: M1 family metallopeptidase [Bacteroidota bacterium]
MLRLFLVLLLIPAFACGQRQHPARPTDSGGPLMPEQAAYDVTFYDLDLDVRPETKSIAGTIEVHGRMLHPLEHFVLDLDTLLTASETWQVRNGERLPATFEQRGTKLWISLDGTRQPGEPVQVGVQYEGVPRVAPNPPWVGGFTWSETEDGSPWIATSVQGDGADVWWPAKDHPSDEPDSMRMRYTVPAGLVAASNGRLLAQETLGDGREAYTWFVSTPINNYGVALNVAPYRVISDTYVSTAGDSLEFSFYTLPESYEKAEVLFPELIEHLRWYEETIGPYPFRADKYGVVETPHLGMEHQTITAYGNQFREGQDGFDWLHHHELGHEWWGNLVTALDWRDFWIHEGFCAYMQPLYGEHLEGRGKYHEMIMRSRKGVLNVLPLAPRESMSENDMYLLPPDGLRSNSDIYAKGAWVLHTLRYLIGDEDFMVFLRRMAYPDPAMEAITDGRQVRFATSDDVVNVAEAVTGRDLEWFFEVYLRQPALPKLAQERIGDVLALRWDVPGDRPFPMPVDVVIDGATQRVELPASLTVPAGAEVQVDPNVWILRD